MPKIIFYPLGNADSCLVKLDSKRMLFDFADLRDSSNKDDTRIDLSTAIREDINWPDNKEIDVVAFTHLDNDHIAKSSDFFFLEHAAKYQVGDRVKIKELWVPAAALTEDGAEDEARVIRQEARYRLKSGKGIRIFSRPAHLKAWFEREGLNMDNYLHLISDAGRLVPGITKEADGVEFFVHSPFGERDGNAILDRNEHSLVFQAAFSAGDTRFLMAADTVWQNWEKIVYITHLHKNDERLAWDIYKLPHHCSYLSLAEDKGKTETKPVDNVEWLLQQGKSRPIVVSTSQPIDDEDQGQPPHFQAKNCYKRVLNEKSGKMIVTMEHPNRISPKRLIIDITAGGASIGTVSGIGGGGLVSAPAPRAG